MTNVWGHIAGVVTVILMLTFIGIWVWAWLPRHGRVFSSLARIPMGDAPSDADGREEQVER